MQTYYTQHDIRFGRGKGFQSREGNQALFFLCCKEASAYKRARSHRENAPRETVIRRIIHTLTVSQGRTFYKVDENGEGFEADPDEVYRKVRDCIAGIIKKRSRVVPNVLVLGNANLVTGSRTGQWTIRRRQRPPPATSGQFEASMRTTSDRRTIIDTSSNQTNQTILLETAHFNRAGLARYNEVSPIMESRIVDISATVDAAIAPPFLSSTEANKSKGVPQPNLEMKEFEPFNVCFCPKCNIVIS